MAKTTKPAMTQGQLEQAYDTEEKCKAELVALRWPDGKIHCPRCNLSIRTYALRTRPFHWVCKHCAKNGYRFSVLTGSIFENTNVPLRTWFRVIFAMCHSKKGISALQVHRIIDPVRGSKGSYRTAWYMCHRIRAAMKNETFRGLAGVIEMDETYVGGSSTNAHRGNRGKKTSAVPGKRGNLVPPKAPVVGAIARKGNVVCQMIERVTEVRVGAFAAAVVSDKVSLVATDQKPLYNHIDFGGARHEAVDHHKGEYVRGQIHTANLDSFWSLLKRGIMGTYHQVSKSHLPLYLNEFSFRHNNRNNPDIFKTVLASC